MAGKSIKQAYHELMQAMVRFNEAVVEANLIGKATQGTFGAYELYSETTKLREALKNASNKLQRPLNQM